MNFEKQSEMSDESLEIHKEIFMTSGGIKVGQSLSEYKAEREVLWDKMHPPKMEAVAEMEQTPSLGDEIEDSKSVQIPDSSEDLRIQAKRDSEAKDQERLEKVRQELGIDNPSGSQFEKEKVFKKQVSDFIQIIIKDDDFRGLMDKWRNTKFASESDTDFQKRNSASDLDMIGRMSASMYDLIHNSGMTFKEVTDEIKLPNKDEFIRNFSSEISERLIETTERSSRVRHISEEELIKGGQPDQAAGYVWFKGNAPRPHNAREVRFYINASPTGTTNVAEYLGKVSDVLDKYGMRLQFKFRKDLGEYDRTDTCVAYLYMPETNTQDKKIVSDQWLEKIKEMMQKIPKDVVRDQNSFFTDRITGGISFVEDTREKEGKKGESYTSQITKNISESAGELSSKYRDLTPEAVEEISSKTVEKLKKMNYFNS